MTLFLNRRVSVLLFAALSQCAMANNTDSKVTINANNNSLSAEIIRTDYGIPHITADNLKGLGFGNGYAQAQDSICTLADGYVRVNSERSKYFGADKSVAGDGANIVSDFGYKALKIRSTAEQKWPQFSDDSRQLTEGYVAGYNYYLSKVKAGEQNLPAGCSDAPWVKNISAIDVVAYSLAFATMNGSEQLIASMFEAHPGAANEHQPRLKTSIGAVSAATSGHTNKQAQNKFVITSSANTEFLARDLRGMGSNGWGLGESMTENGQGILLANPHYPFTGNLRFWQSHATIPGDLNVHGASILGMPGVISVGFNENLAWTHTVSPADHMVIYQLTLDPEDSNRYLVDGNSYAIDKSTYTIEVKTDSGSTILEKDLYSTEIGPIIEHDSLFPWTNEHVYAVKDVNIGNIDMLDNYLAMNRAQNLEEFKQALEDYDGTVFSTTIYSDKEGNSFYADDSTVPNLSAKALALLESVPELAQFRKTYEYTLLPGHSSDLIFDGAVPYQQSPKLQRRDYVQNSNDSYWATNVDQLMTGHSLLYGTVNETLPLRTRMSLTMLKDSSGDDGRFNMDEVEQAMLSNRALLGELILDDLLLQCRAQGDDPVQVTDNISTSVQAACNSLANWSGQQNNDTTGSHLLREFANIFSSYGEKIMFSQAFDTADPVNTPNTLTDSGAALKALAHASLNLQAAGFNLSETLGQVQFVERTNPDGSPTGLRFPWSGSEEIEGGFNVFWPTSESTITAPLHNYQPAVDVVNGEPLPSGLTTEGYHVRVGSSWIMLVAFTDEGPEARGLLTYSQSLDPASPHYNDQTRLYSEQKQLRPILFKRDDIEAHQLSREVIRLVNDCNQIDDAAAQDPSWQEGRAYLRGERVSHGQLRWQALFWNSDVEPSLERNNGEWELLSDVDRVWYRRSVYRKGVSVHHQGYVWLSNHWTLGQEPKEGASGWERQGDSDCVFDRAH